MSLIPISGNAMAFPSLPWSGPVGTLNAITLTASDATQKIAYMGQVHNADFATKNIQGIKYRQGNLTWGVSSVLTISLQDIGATGGPVVPDEAIDQSFTLTGPALAANTWAGGTFSSKRNNVAWGDRLAVVFQISTFTAGDSVQLQNNKISAALEFNFPCISKKNTTWAADTSSPSILFEFDDGTYGTFLGSCPILQRNSNQFSSASSPNEYALHFVSPAPMRVHGCWMECSHDNANSTSTVSLYDAANNVLASKNLDQTWFHNLTTQRYIWVSFGQSITLAANAVYRLGWKATAANNITIIHHTMQSATDFRVTDGIDNIYLESRTDSGAWSPTTTRRPRMGLLLTHVDDGVFPSFSGGRGRRR
jgi:hypothetical protein